MTHAELVNRAERWLRNTFHCRVVMTELVAYTKSCETPDAIGWVNGRCILVECKASLADLRADRRKLSRRGYVDGLGDWRFYLVDAAIIKGNNIPELPSGWGMYAVDGKQIRHVTGSKYSNAGPAPCESCKDSEIALLVSALSRRERRSNQ